MSSLFTFYSIQAASIFPRKGDSQRKTDRKNTNYPKNGPFRYVKTIKMRVQIIKITNN